MRTSSASLLGSGTELGIISLELAGSRGNAASVVGAWERRGVLGVAVTNVWLDYPFLLVYAAALALATSMASDVLGGRPRAARLGVVLAWGALAAGLFDVIENLALFRMLGDPAQITGAASWLAASSATLKFALVIAALLYSAAGGMAWIAGRITRRG